ncbi:MAG: hypothetical protein ACHQU8_08380 [Gemmatimonadales bacterium]
MMQLVERGGRITARSPIDDRVLRYAPLLRFTPEETHFPIDPSTFVEKALLRRYGWSEEVRDGVWHPRRSCWESAPTGLPASADALGPDLNEACRLIQFEARGTEAGFNRRPCDARNLWHGRRAGYALELAQPLSRDLRGVPGAAPWLLYDRYSIETAVGPREVIGYWFFYALKPTAQAHEGAWEHVSLVLSGVGAAPLVRFEGPAGAVTFGLADVETVEDTHPVLYVESGSHMMFRTADEIGPGSADSYSLLLRSWRLEPRRMPAMSWSCFDGAWGRVGSGPRTTGPLGPLFRRETAATIARSVASESRP